MRFLTIVSTGYQIHVTQLRYHVVKWDPSRENIQHFNESVVLYTTYYGIQVRLDLFSSSEGYIISSLDINP